MDFKTLLANKEFILLDGAMGTMIQKSGAGYRHSPETLNLTRPELITSFHRAYIEAGADIIYTNTFGANAYKLGDSGFSAERIIAAAIANAKKACEGTQALVALDIGPVGMLAEPAGAMRFEEAYDYFKQQIIAGADADLIVLETMTDLYELKAAVLAAKDATPTCRSLSRRTRDCPTPTPTNTISCPTALQRACAPCCPTA